MSQISWNNQPLTLTATATVTKQPTQFVAWEYYFSPAGDGQYPIMYSIGEAFIVEFRDGATPPMPGVIIATPFIFEQGRLQVTRGDDLTLVINDNSSSYGGC